MNELNNEVEINASAERVWQLLTDFDRFPQWNPFIHRASGQPVMGAQLNVTFQPSAGHRTTVQPTVVKVEPNHELRWMSRSLLPGVHDTEHIFTILSLDATHVRFTQREIISGIFASFHLPHRSAEIRRGFREMNEALKMRAEHGHSAD